MFTEASTIDSADRVKLTLWVAGLILPSVMVNGWPDSRETAVTTAFEIAEAFAHEAERRERIRMNKIDAVLSARPRS